MTDKGNVITPNIMNTMGLMSPLLFFDSIIDTDFGVIVYTYEELLDENIFDRSKFDLTEVELVRKLCNRTNMNPLLDFMKEPDEDVANEFIGIVMDDEESFTAIFDKSKTTAIFDLMLTFDASIDIRPTILVHTDLEYKLLSSFMNEYHASHQIPIVKYRDITEKDIQSFQQIFCKTSFDIFLLLKRSKIEDKTIYMSRYPFNTFEDPLLELVFQRNIVNSISPYKQSILAEESDNDNDN